MSKVNKIKVNCGYSSEERELSLVYGDKDDVMRIFTNIPTYKTKLNKVNADLIQCEYYVKKHKDEDGNEIESEVEVSWIYEIAPNQLSFRNKPKTENEMTAEELEKYNAKKEKMRRLAKERFGK